MSFELFLRDNKEAVDINVSIPTDANALADFIEKKKIDTIVISIDFEDKEVANVNFLANIINKENINEIHIYGEVEDYSFVYKFKNLRKITLCYYNRIATNIDLTMLPRLECLSLNGDINIDGLESSKLKELLINNSDTFRISSRCESLEKLTIIKPKLFDLKQLNFLPNLKKLILTQLKIENLDGIEKALKLVDLQVNYCSKLIDISQISHCTKLRKLEFDSNKKIESFESLELLKNLIGLVIDNCGSIYSLSFIKKMSGLKFLSFVNTNIVDGDLTECLKLQCVGTNDKRHYNVKSKNLPRNHDYAFWKL